MDQYISICPICGHVYGHSNVKTIPCGNCGKSETVESGYMKAAWEQMSSAEKANVVATCKTMQGTSLVDQEPSQRLFGSSYSNPGRALVILAIVLRSIVSGIGVFVGIATIFVTKKVLLGLLIILVVPLLGYISGLGLAAFGRLVENTTELVKLAKEKE